MPRLLFEKKGNAVWISHLDLMRVFQRAFKRAGLPLTHTQGFNPRPSVSIALPLSVGIESSCELLDFDLDGDKLSGAEIKERLNPMLISGLTVLDVYEDGRKIRDIAYLDCLLRLEYENGIPENAAEQMKTLFSQDEVVVTKKNKNGISEQNIIPMIRKLSIQAAEEQAMEINCRICCQNPSLNPMQLIAAITKYIPECAPDYVFCARKEIYDTNEKVFR